jgi:NAD(P)-dependent dehydrogenase (short-subunit alcohol dehydrogenase family)
MPSDLLKTFEINVLGPLKTLRALVPVMKLVKAEEEGKKILLMSSELASIEKVKVKEGNSPSYSISKVSRSGFSLLIRRMRADSAAFNRPLLT